MSKEKSSSKRKPAHKSHRVDHIPHCGRKPRTVGSPKRRINFSPFFSSSFSLSNPLRGKERASDKRKEISEFPPAACSSTQDKRRGLFSDITEIPVIEVESVGQNVVFEACVGPVGRSFEKQSRGTVMDLELLEADKSLVTENSSICVAPGRVVWVKKACHSWWPAKIMGERAIAVDSSHDGIDGLVLVQYYGTRQRAWVDPAKDLSEFGECFEERSCNPADEFQDALKKALHQRQQQSLSRHFSELSNDRSHPKSSNQGDQSPADKWISSSSSRTESASVERRRGKRERKPKLHFDEVALPLKLARGHRRLKIMQSLGLAAPAGSPF